MTLTVWNFPDCSVSYAESDGMFTVAPATGGTPYYYIPEDDGDTITMIMSLNRGESPLANGGPFPLGFYI